MQSQTVITLDSQGPFRMAVDRGPALPAHRLEVQDKPTAELHPVGLSSTAVLGHSSHLTLHEDPVLSKFQIIQCVNEMVQ